MRATQRSAGYDLYSPKTFTIYCGCQELVDLGFVWKPEPDPDIVKYLPDRPWDFENKLQFFAKIFDKSGLAVKFRFSTRAGVIDVDYRDPWGLVCVNEGSKPITFDKGQKLSQFVLIPYLFAEDEQRGHWVERRGGFGSTGV